MALAQDLMGVGMPSEQALRIGYQLVNINAAGTAQGTATEITAAQSGNVYAVVVPASNQQGVRLPASAEITTVVAISPTLATPLITVYPSTGQTIDLLSANTGIAFTTANKNAYFVRVSPTNWRSVISGPA